MKLNDYVDKLLPEEVELSQETRERILSNAAVPSGKRRRPLRLALVAACLAVILGAAVYAVVVRDWNRDYREHFHVKSESVQGLVEYPEVTVTEEATIQPVSCVTGLTLFECRFTYGPISQEEAQDFDFKDGLQEMLLQVDVEELPKYDPDATLCEYDAESGMALFKFSVWHDEMPEQLSMTVSKLNMQTGEVLEEVGTMVMHPEEPEMKTATLNLPITAPDGREAKILALRVDTGSYCWVYDIPGMEDWNGDFDAAIRDPEFSKYTTDISNLVLEQYIKGKDCHVNYADGSTFPIGSGLGCMWDGEHFCEWSNGVYDMGNLVSVTINGVEYPFE